MLIVLTILWVFVRWGSFNAVPFGVGVTTSTVARGKE